ncbi:MAG: hypothetical protein ACLFQ8_00795 [Candidatus Aenigmatarchaeota archaeon]
MKKGLSQILAFMLLTLLAVVIVGSVATWMRKTEGEAEEGIGDKLTGQEDIHFYISGVEEQDGYVYVNVTNNGRFEIHSGQMTGYFEGDQKDVEQIGGPDPIPPGETGKFNVTV